MACPYFIPDERHEGELWPHRGRLPLGDGFRGSCGADGAGKASCDDETLRSHCNLGYSTCAHLPAERDFDAVRFQVQSESSTILRIQFACEAAHKPALAGELLYDRSAQRWMERPDPRLLPLAEAAVRAWIRKHDRGLGGRSRAH